MGEQVYRIEFLRDRVVALLQERKATLTAGAIAVALDLPFWAVQAGVEAALAADQVQFCTLGYSVSAVPEVLQ